MKNRNTKVVANARYAEQQKAINEICEKRGLVAFRPNYHAVANDCNTVLIYSKAAHDYNQNLEKEYRQKYGAEPHLSLYKPFICFIDNTDANGGFSYDFMNRGTIDLRGLHFAEKIEKYIDEKQKGENK